VTSNFSCEQAISSSDNPRGCRQDLLEIVEDHEGVLLEVVLQAVHECRSGISHAERSSHGGQHGPRRPAD
jgi:hypothetical protein